MTCCHVWKYLYMSEFSTVDSVGVKSMENRCSSEADYCLDCREIPCPLRLWKFYYNVRCGLFCGVDYDDYSLPKCDTV
jgi:hypothetical protein